MIGEPFSSISGFVINNTFYGSVYMTHVIHFLEPWRPTIKVSSEDGGGRGGGEGVGEGYRALLHSVKGIQQQSPTPTPPAPDVPWSEPPPAKSCEITIVSDAEFFHQVGDGNVKNTVTQMVWFLKVRQLLSLITIQMKINIMFSNFFRRQIIY